MSFVLAAQGATIPTVPTITVGSPTNTSLTITLTVPSIETVYGIDGYDIERSTDGGVTWLVVARVIDLPYVVNFLTTGTAYKFRARGVSLSPGAYRSGASAVVSGTTTGGGPPPPLRRYFPGWCISISTSQSAGNVGIPNGGTVSGTYPNNVATGGVVSNNGPVSSGVSSVNTRHSWGQLDNGDGTYNWTSTDREMAQARGLNVGLYFVIITRTFAGDVFNFSSATKNGGTLTGVPNSFSNDTFGAVFSNGEKRQNVVMTGSGTTRSVSWSPALATVPTDVMIVPLSNNPMPVDLLDHSEPFRGNVGSGWQGWRWSPDVLVRFQAFIAALVGRYGAEALFGGVGTQETSVGGADGGAAGNYTRAIPGQGNYVGSDAYSSANWQSACIMESKIVAAADGRIRHILFQNFGMTVAQLLTVAIAVQPLGTIWCGPDLVTDQGASSVLKVYANYQKYALGTGGVPAPGITACSIQPSEWQGDRDPAQHPVVSPPAQGGPGPRNPSLPDLFNWMTSSNIYPVSLNTGARDHSPTATPTSQRSQLTLQMCLADYHVPANANGDNFSSAGAGGIKFVQIMADHPTFGTLVPNP